MSNIGELRVVIADESLGLPERRAAAEHYLAELVEAVPAPAEDDAEVVELRTPWKAEGEMGKFMQSGWRSRNTVYGWSPDGPTLTQAKLHVHDRMKLRALLGIIVDDSAHHLERLEACRGVLGRLSLQNFYRVNGYTPERMLAEVKPDTELKRPPREFSDVW
jgi:hypothetical protein